MFSDQVRHALIDTKTTQVQLAEKIGVKQANLSAALKKDDFKTSYMKKIAEALDCELVIKLVPKSTDS